MLMCAARSSTAFSTPYERFLAEVGVDFVGGHRRPSAVNQFG
jgi:hypothetical protein